MEKQREDGERRKIKTLLWSGSQGIFASILMLMLVATLLGTPRLPPGYHPLGNPCPHTSPSPTEAHTQASRHLEDPVSRSSPTQNSDRRAFSHRCRHRPSPGGTGTRAFANKANISPRIQHLGPPRLRFGAPVAAKPLLTLFARCSPSSVFKHDLIAACQAGARCKCGPMPWDPADSSRWKQGDRGGGRIKN